MICTTLPLFVIHSPLDGSTRVPASGCELRGPAIEAAGSDQDPAAVAPLTTSINSLVIPAWRTLLA